MAVYALQGVVFGRYHVGQGPVHFGFGKAVVSAVGESCGFGPQASRLIPIEIGPVAAFANGLGDDDVIVSGVINLFGAVNFEGPYFGGWVVNVSVGQVDGRRLAGVDFIAQQVTVCCAVEPVVFRLQVFLVDKGAFDFQIRVNVFFFVVGAGG